jgi:pimeloyl-ACP methyl ester carboxylesterase
VVFLHGLGDSWHSWDLVLPRLPDRYRAVAVTMRGHGWSDKPEKGYSHQDFAADVTALLEQLDLKNVTLVGHSLGSLVAQVVAEQDKGRLSRLVLVGSGPGGPRDEKSREELRQAFQAIKDPMTETFARDFQASTTYLPVQADFFETMSRELARVPARVWHEFNVGTADDGAVERLKDIRVPTLIFWGDRDSIFSRADQNVLVARIPNARLTVYADTGHALHWERPEKFATDLLAFLAGK